MRCGVCSRKPPANRGEAASARAEPKPSRPPKKKPPRSARAVANSGRSFAQLRSRRKQQGAPVVGSFD